MEKAFLSHSSLDKEYVRLVARKLRRYQVEFDENNFAPGEDFRIEINMSLKRCNLFVFFASKASLLSGWVNFEIDQVELNKIKGENISFLVVILDNSKHSDLPNWMQKMKIIKAPGVNQTADMIQKRLLDSIASKNQLYIGREEDMLKISSDITKAMYTFPNCIAITGLEGVGRRCFTTHFMESYFSLNVGAIIELDENQGMDDLYLKLCNENIENFSSDEIVESITTYKNVSDAQKISEIVRMLSAFSDMQSFPIILDNGALLNNEGLYRKDFFDVISEFKLNHNDAYMVIIHKRYPQLTYEQLKDQTVYICRLNPLNNDSTKRLLSKLLITNSIKDATAEQIQEISEYLDGYPPAIEWATIIAKQYGIDALYSDKRLLLDFKIKTFAQYIKMLELDDNTQNLLRALNNLSKANIKILSLSLSIEESMLTQLVMQCMDNNLIILENGLYKISPPIRNTIYNLYGNFTKAEFSMLAKRLMVEYWDDNSIPNLQVLDVMVLTLLRADLDVELEKFKNLTMPSNLLRAARDSYNSGDWKLSEKYSRKVLDVDPSSDDARIILFKSIVRQGILQEDQMLEQILTTLTEHYNKSVFYLRGFREWKKGQYYNAIEFYRQAKLSGDKSIPVYRELAECLYWVNQISEAKKEISIILDKDKVNNRFMLDLASKIAIADKDFEKADEYLTKQELVDKAENIEHRRATYFVAKENYPQALIHADNACGGQKLLPQMFLLRIKINIELRNYPSVDKDLEYIKNNFKWFTKDILYILQARTVLKRDGWKNAEIVFSNIRNKDSNSAKGLMVLILNQKFQDPSVPIFKKQGIELKLSHLNSSKAYDVLSKIQLFESGDVDMNDAI